MKQNQPLPARLAACLFFGLALVGLFFSCVSGGPVSTQQEVATRPPAASPSPPPPAASPLPDQAAALQAVSLALASGDAGKAVAEYETFSQRDAGRESPQSRLLLGNLLLSDGQLDKAGSTFQSVLASLDASPADPAEAKMMGADAHYGLYLVALNQGDARSAKRELDQAIAANPDHGGALCALAQVDLANKNYERAAERFDHSLRIDPGNLVAMQGKATVFARTDRLTEAINLLCEVLAIEPANLQALADRGKYYSEVMQWDASLADLAVLIGHEPDNYLNYLDRARIFVRAGRVDEGLADFARVLQLQPDATLALVYRGQVYWQAGRFEEARQDMEAVLKVRPGYLPVVEPLALMAWKSGRFADSARYFEMEYDQRLKNDEVLALAIAAHYMSGDKAALKAAADRLQSKIPQDSPFYQTIRLMLDPRQEGSSLELMKGIKNTVQLGRFKLLTAVPLIKMGRRQTGINILKDVIDSMPAESAEGRIATWMIDEYQR